MFLSYIINRKTPQLQSVYSKRVGYNRETHSGRTFIEICCWSWPETDWHEETTLRENIQRFKKKKKTFFSCNSVEEYDTWLIFTHLFVSISLPFVAVQHEASIVQSRLTWEVCVRVFVNSFTWCVMQVTIKCHSCCGNSTVD